MKIIKKELPPIIGMIVIVIISLLLITFMNSCSTTQHGYNYKAHSKKSKQVIYRGDLTNYKCHKIKKR